MIAESQFEGSMQACTDTWRSTVLTLFAAVLGLVLLSVGAANACPHHKAAQKQAAVAAVQHERMSEPPATKPQEPEHASHATRSPGHRLAACPRMRHGGISDCSTCCGIGSTNAQRPQDVVLVDIPAEPTVLDALAGMLLPAMPTAVDPFPDRQWHSAAEQTGKTRLVSISRRLRL